MKRSCGSCRFYQEAGLAGSGWCHHPQRRTSSHALIMVRKGELACRNGWSHDLWTPKATHDADAAADQPPQTPAGPVDPANPDDIAAIIKASASLDDEARQPRPMTPTSVEDVVVGQTAVMPEHQTDSDDRAAVLAQDTRAAILRARDRHRAKHAHRTRHMERPASDALGLAGSDTGDFPPYAASRPIEPPARTGLRRLDRFSTGESRQRNPSNPIEPVPPSESPPSGRPPSRFTRTDDPFDSVPQVRPDFELPRAKPAARQPFISSNEAGDTAAVNDQNATEPDDRVLLESDPELVAGDTAEPVIDARLEGAIDKDQIEALQSPQPEESTPTESTWTPGMSAYDLVLNRARQIRDAAYRDYGAEANAQARSELAADEESREPFDGPPADRVLDFGPEPEPKRGVALHVDRSLDQELGATPYLDDDDLDDQDLIHDVLGFAELDDDLDMSVQIAPDVPRMCRTCRDFRPADSGERGWCTNNWAFTHRRMVDADELPCETSVGCWWLPHDDVWLSNADILAHGQPTPLVNSWLAQREAATIAAHGPDRKRKRS